MSEQRTLYETNLKQQPRKLLTSMESAEWYTNPVYLRRVRELFGGVIDLDPASNLLVNQMLVNATYYYNIETDGLQQPWFGNVFCNPPYVDPFRPRVPVAPKWAEKAIFEYAKPDTEITNMILLLNAKIGYNWVTNLIDNDNTTVLLHRDRMYFIAADKLQLVNDKAFSGKPSRQPQMTVYFGCQRDDFIDLFRPLGWILR